MKRIQRCASVILGCVWLISGTRVWGQVSSTTSTIDVPGALSTQAFGINPRGDIVGFYSATGFTAHGFLFHGGTFTAIDVPGASCPPFFPCASTVALGINPNGDIVGSYFAGFTNHGFLLHRGAFTTIDVPGALSTQAFGINPQGDMGAALLHSLIPPVSTHSPMM